MRLILLLATVALAPQLALAQITVAKPPPAPTVSAPKVPAPPSAEQVALATAVVSGQGDIIDIVGRGLHVVMPNMSPDQQARFNKLAGAVIASHKTDILALNPPMIDLYARTFTTDQLRQMSAYYATPISKAITVKTLEQGMGMTGVPIKLTPAETKAQADFMATAAGHAIAEHQTEIAGETLALMQPLMMTMIGEVLSQRCYIDNNCPSKP